MRRHRGLQPSVVPRLILLAPCPCLGGHVLTGLRIQTGNLKRGLVVRAAALIALKGAKGHDLGQDQHVAQRTGEREVLIRPLAAVRQRGSLKPLGHALAGPKEFGRYDLDRDFAIERDVMSEVHVRHATLADLGDYVILPECGLAERLEERLVACCARIYLGSRKTNRSGVGPGNSRQIRAALETESRLGGYRLTAPGTLGCCVRHNDPERREIGRAHV